MTQFPPRGGRGWTIADIGGYTGTFGTHDLSAALGATTMNMVLVVLRAAESWAPDRDNGIRPHFILCRAGAVRAELGNDTTLELDGMSAIGTPGLRLLTNTGTAIAEVLAIGPLPRT